MRYSYGNGPQSLAFVIYAGLAILLGLPFLSEGDERLERLWEIYMTPMFDEEPIFPLVFAAVTSLGLSLIYFSKWFSEFSSRPSTGVFVPCYLSSCFLMLSLTLATLSSMDFSLRPFLPSGPGGALTQTIIGYEQTASNTSVKASPSGRWTLRGKAPRSAPYLQR